MTLPAIQYLDYYNEHTDFVLYAGPALYLGKWIIEYKFFRNESNPGNVVSYSHVVKVGYYSNGWFWTSLI